MSVQQTAFISLVLLATFQHSACVCKVTCSTDFISTLNCSCSVHGPMVPCRVEADCWDVHDRVKGSCEMRPPQLWCQMEPQNFSDIISFGTNCTARVKYPNAEGNELEDYTHLTLYQHIRLLPPLDMQLTEGSGMYNLSWEMAYTEDENYYLTPHLMYRVRIQAAEGLLKEPMYFLVKNKQFFPVPHESLQEGAEYAADVQATVNPAIFHAHWSDWGPNVKWKIKSQDYKAKLPYFILLLVSLPCLILCYCVKVGRLKKMCPQWYVASPKDFFEPLYHTHQGDFKKWVGQTFTLCEFDFLEKSLDVQVLNRKRTGVPQGLCRSGCEVSGASRRLDASSALSPAHSSVQSAGNISIHTVTLSGDDSRCLGGSLGPYGGSQNSLTYPGCGLGGAEGPLDVGPEGEWVASGVGMAREGPSGLPAVSGSYRMEWQLVAGDNELERISLDSFSSAERTEDGYPAMELDLDTIDSGFQEADCTSPIKSEFSSVEPGEEPGLGGAGNSHTNYVKQWLACTSGVVTQGGSTD